ncbi:hypothetical protein T484DRAFT_3478998 [Baffinella frigidus]|nr:hypothetical protein T484DRAFT_3478998 [Cryptophyta sp. CCMP2293]
MRGCSPRVLGAVCSWSRLAFMRGCGPRVLGAVFSWSRFFLEPFFLGAVCSWSRLFLEPFGSSCEGAALAARFDLLLLLPRRVVHLRERQRVREGERG